MKTYRKLTNGLAMAAMVLASAATARAGIFTWSAPAPITTADATLNQTGTIVGAEVFGNDAKLVVLGDGTTVDFKADFSVAQVTIGSSPFTAYGGFTNNDTGNKAFKDALTQFNYDNGPKNIALVNLVPGQQYSVQLFALDRRDTNAAARQANYQDPADAGNVSATFAMGDNVYVIGTFTAPGSTVDIQQNLPTGGNGNINALVVRAIGTNVAPQITTQPQPATKYNGTTATLTAGALGTGPLSYQWQKSNVGGSLFTNVVNGGTISGATSNSLVISSLVAGDEGDYQVVVSNLYGVVTSAPVATVTVLAGTPQFAWSEPTPITTADGTLNQSGSVVGATVFGTTSKIVVLTNGTSIDFKNDAVVAAVTAGSSVGTATGAYLGNTGNADFNGALTQFNYDNGPKTITLTNLVAGQQYAVQLFALDNRLGGLGGAIARLANFQNPADPFNVSSTFAMGDNAYVIGTFTASNSWVDIQENLPTQGNSGNINALVLRRLTGLPVAPQITTSPSSKIANGGSTVSFAVGANGSSLNYQWQRAAVGSGVFSNITDPTAGGVNTAQLSLTNVNSGSIADYRVIVSNIAGAVTSSPPATLTVNLSVTLAHRWSFSEGSGTTTADSVGGANGTLQGGAVLGGGFVNLPNGDLSNATSYVSIPGGLLNNMASVTMQCWVTNNGWNNGNTFVGFGGNWDSGGVGTNFIGFLARWTPSISALQIQTTVGDSGIVNLGPRVNYNSATTQPSPAHYAYLYDPNVGTVVLYTNGVLSGSATGVNIPLSTLGTNIGTIGLALWNTNLGASMPLTATGNRPYLNAGVSEVRIYSGIVNSNAIVDAFVLGPDQVPAAPVITSQPSSTSVYLGATAQFTVGATGNPLNYQWQRAAVGSGGFTNVTAANIGGANTNQLTVTNATAVDVADYRVIISNGSGSVTSSPAATLTLVATLAHRWSFSEASGTTTVDTVGGATGTLQGGAVLGGGFVRLPNAGAATDDSYVSIPGGLLNNMAAVSVECWVTNNGWNNGNTFVGFGGETDPSGSGTNFIGFLSRWTPSVSAFQIQTTAGDSGVVALGPRVNYNAATTQPSPAHYAFLYNPASGSVALYTNGVLSGSATGANISLSTLGTNLGTIGKAVWNTNFGATMPLTASGNRPFMNAGFSEVRIYNGVLSPSAIAAGFQLGPDQLLSTPTTNRPPLSVVNAPGTLTLSWPTTDSGFFVESSPVLGTGAVWTLVPGKQLVVGPNYTMTLPTTNGAAMFFRLRQ